MSRTTPTERGAGTTPACPHCGTSEHVVRLWHGRAKVWVCSIHFRIRSTEAVPQTLKQRLLHRKPEEKTFALSEVLPNRAARRRQS